jgi:hypothetical protein
MHDPSFLFGSYSDPETKETLARRIARVETGMVWAEDPPSRTRHMLSNIEVEPGNPAQKLHQFLSSRLPHSGMAFSS